MKVENLLYCCINLYRKWLTPYTEMNAETKNEKIKASKSEHSLIN